MENKHIGHVFESSLRNMAEGTSKVIGIYANKPTGVTVPVFLQPSDLSKATKDIMAERQRQIDVKGWTAYHDDQYTNNELSFAAASYAAYTERNTKPWLWPWDASFWKPTDRRSNLVKAGALILAEIERLDRSEAAAKKDGSQ